MSCLGQVPVPRGPPTALECLDPARPPVTRPAAPTAGVLRRGFGVLWVAVKEEPRIFALSAVGSALFAVTTIAPGVRLRRRSPTA